MKMEIQSITEISIPFYYIRILTGWGSKMPCNIFLLGNEYGYSNAYQGFRNMRYNTKKETVKSRQIPQISKEEIIQYPRDTIYICIYGVMVMKHMIRY